MAAKRARILLSRKDSGYQLVRECPEFVFPAKAGIQKSFIVAQDLRTLRHIPIIQLVAVDCGESTAQYRSEESQLKLNKKREILRSACGGLRMTIV